MPCNKSSSWFSTSPRHADPPSSVLGETARLSWRAELGLLRTAGEVLLAGLGNCEVPFLGWRSVVWRLVRMCRPAHVWDVLLDIHLRCRRSVRVRTGLRHWCKKQGLKEPRQPCYGSRRWACVSWQPQFWPLVHRRRSSWWGTWGRKRLLNLLCRWKRRSSRWVTGGG